MSDINGTSTRLGAAEALIGTLQVSLSDLKVEVHNGFTGIYNKLDTLIERHDTRIRELEQSQAVSKTKLSILFAGCSAGMFALIEGVRHLIGR